MRKGFIIDTVRHNLTGKQILDQLFAVFERDLSADVWLVIPKNTEDSVKGKIRVALAKERAIIRDAAAAGIMSEDQARSSRLFTLEMSDGVAPCGRHRSALRIRYGVTEAQQKTRRYMRYQQYIHARKKP